ncbi:PstS family phosphate ABC transporter substrate-binding protein [Rufibacter sp. LB8]|uniref:PstS family phosphate ABC transporter substrate-binding protein n=1 Tax=Rufibacter sp. LB8 TaxID=2777781 RepID=UPI00178C180C|nr:substrate-binding domain-containing protein [Rufibacter sp. LB8]
MTKASFFTPLLVAGLAIMGTACNQSGKVLDTPTSGHIKISVDETFAPIMEAEANAFQGLYKYAKIQAEYKPETEVIRALLEDTVRLVISTRHLTDKEVAELDKQKLVPRTTKIAVDGIALILNNENTDSTLTLQQVRDIFTGKTTTWKQLDPTNKGGEITIVFDSGNSSTARYILDSINQKQPLPANTFSANSNSKVLDYVAQNRNAIGIIGVNWISDRDDSTATSFLKNVKVAGISRNPNPTSEEEYVQPYQAFLAQGTYPLRREVYMISKEARAGLGTGFASFLVGDKGQRIILKSGLVPASMPVRIVSITE